MLIPKRDLKFLKSEQVNGIILQKLNMI